MIGGGPQLKATPAGVSAEYLEALKVLSEETMAKACDLLLSERDYQEPEDDDTDQTTKNNNTAVGEKTKSDLEQLQDLYQQCRQAAAVVAKEAAAAPPPPQPAGHAARWSSRNDSRRWWYRRHGAHPARLRQQTRHYQE